MARKMALVPQELVSEYYQINKPEIRLEDNIASLLEQNEIPDDLRGKLLSQMIPQYQKLMQPPPPQKPFEIPAELLTGVDEPETPKLSVERKSTMLLKYLAHAVPKTKRKFIEPIIERLEKANYIFNDQNELMVEGKTQYRSNVLDLFAHLMRDARKNEPPPKGFDVFLKGILETNIPHVWIGNKKIRESMLHSQADPLLGLASAIAKTPSPVKWEVWTE